jgi:hypothetical protein
VANSSGLYGARGVRVVIVDSPFDEGAAWCEWAENRTKQVDSIVSIHVWTIRCGEIAVSGFPS